MNIIRLALFIILASFFLTLMIFTFLRKKNIVDIPNERSSHTEPTPRGGGIAIVITWYLGISVLFLNGQVEQNLYYSLMCGILIAVVSLIDDLVNLKPTIRLITHSVTVLIAFVILNGMHPVLLSGETSIPSFLLYPAMIVGMVWFINLYNFLDGIDGYASVEAIMIAFAIFLLTGNIIAIILMASVTGFLIWNWPKARIFMGDIGSTQLGFIIAILGLYFHNINKLPIVYWLILLAPFWFDASLTLYRRWRNREKLSIAHRKHIYQRLVQSGFSHLKVDILLTLINIVLLSLVFFFRQYEVLQIPLLLLTIMLMYLIALYADRRKSFQ